MTVHVEFMSRKILSLISGITYNQKKDTLYFNSRAIPGGLAFWDFCKKALGDNGVFELRRDNEEAYLEIVSNGVSCEKVRSEILRIKKDEASQAQEQQEVDISVIRYNDSTPTLDKLLVIENPLENNSKNLYDPEKDLVYPYSNIDKTLERLLGKQQAATYLNIYTRQCKFVYEPFKERLYKENGHWVFNEYSDPEWRVGWTPDSTIKEPPKEIDEFLHHISPNPHEFLYPILRTLLDGRLDFATILRGTPGCGKNILVESIAANIVGCDAPASNYTKATRGFQTSNFHDYLAKVRLALWDEAVIKNTLRYCIKDYLNKKANLEGKHKKVTTPSSSHFSIFIANNYKTDINLDFDDRKFLCVPLRDVDLLDVKPQEWVDNFAQVLCKDKEVLRTLASYLYNCIKPIRRPPKTKPFFELCWLSLPQYFRFFIKACVLNKEFTIKEYYQYFPTKDTRPSREKIQDLFYVYAQGNKLTEGIGEFFDSERGKWRFVSNIYGRQDLLEFDDAYQNAKKEMVKMANGSAGQVINLQV